MDRRKFLRGVTASGITLSLPSWAHADATRDSFLANLPQHPRLTSLRGCTSDRLGAAAVVEGRWPTEIAGTFYRNGPGRFERSGERYHHWFDGDGMVHAWHINSGQVRHEACFVRTQKYVEESASGQFLYEAFGTEFTRRPVSNNDTVNTANTNLVPHAGKLYALWEGGSATEINSANLATVGIKTWRDDLAALPFSAHPKITPDGVLWNFGVAPGVNKLLLWRVDADGSLGKFGMIQVPQLPMVHDFVVTARYMIFLVPPFDLHASAHATYLSMHEFNSNRPLRAVVVDRATFALHSVIEMPAGMVFHLGNGWDEGDTVRFDACISNNDSTLHALGDVMRGESWHGLASNSVLVTLNLARGTARSETLLTKTEFPRVAAAVVGQRYRQLFVTTSSGVEDFGMTGVASIDVETGRVDRFEYGPDWVVEEHIPIAKASGGGLWLIGAAYDDRRSETVLAVFDGANLSQGPVARARLPYAAPLCFHGNFLAASA